MKYLKIKKESQMRLLLEGVTFLCMSFLWMAVQKFKQGEVSAVFLGEKYVLCRDLQKR
jgi:hypothetical protein